MDHRSKCRTIKLLEHNIEENRDNYGFGETISGELEDKPDEENTCKTHI